MKLKITEYDLDDESEPIPISKHQQLSYLLLQAKYCIVVHAIEFCIPFSAILISFVLHVDFMH